jgi:type I restriction enzyme S subunit
VKTDGVSQSNINAKKLAAFTFRLPEPDEQREIVERIGTAMEWLTVVASEQGQAAHLLDHLDQGLLAKAFRGELVPQDPTEESADKLLERIRAERKPATPKWSGRRRKAATQ